MAYPIIDLIIGNVTLTPWKRLPAAAFTAGMRKVINAQRSQSGNLHTNTLYKKYTINVSGIAQGVFPELHYEHERDDSIDLHSIVPRIERLSPSGETNAFTISRRTRLDYASIYPTVQYPIGTQIAAASITGLTNTDTTGEITLSFVPTAGTRSLLVQYYPILNGTIVSLDSNYGWDTGEETWSLVFEEM